MLNLLEKYNQQKYITSDGGASQREADLWCTYAAIRTLTWIKKSPAEKIQIKNFLYECQNLDGGFGWRKGMKSDVWATYYCVQALSDINEEINKKSEMEIWLAKLINSDGGIGMTEGQPSDLWATYYGTRIFNEILKKPYPAAEKLIAWLKNHQSLDGGITWSHNRAKKSDVRACYYAVNAFSMINNDNKHALPFNKPALLKWLTSMQIEDGGFVFNDNQKSSCLWATFRAVKALEVLDSKPTYTDTCTEWILSNRTNLSFKRWENYKVSDVWASFSAVGALNALNYKFSEREIDDIESFINKCKINETGYTYREPSSAGDALATSALLIADSEVGIKEYTHSFKTWLEEAHMPYEGGVMYMPGRGSEIRCTLWTIEASRWKANSNIDYERLLDWFTNIQNEDGGYGYWEGRGSDITATISALESIEIISEDSLPTFSNTINFIKQCTNSDGIKFSPNGTQNLISLCMGIRGYDILGYTEKKEYYTAKLENYKSRIGGYSAEPGKIPDLHSTYQAILTKVSTGIEWDANDVLKFIDRIEVEGGFSWSPLGRMESGPLAYVYVLLLRQAATRKIRNEGFYLPKLNL